MGRARAAKQVGDTCGTPFPGLGGLGGTEQGVPSQGAWESPGGCVGCASGSPFPDFLVAMATAGLSWSQRFPPCTEGKSGGRSGPGDGRWK